MPEGEDRVPIDRIVGANMRKFRSLRGLSEQRIADAVGGIDAQDILDYESGKKRPNPRQIAAIADAIGIPVGQFFLGDKKVVESNDNLPPKE